MARRPEHSFMQQSLVASFMEQDENLSVLGKSKINASKIGGQAKFDLTKPDMSIRGNATGDLFLLCLNEFDSKLKGLSFKPSGNYIVAPIFCLLIDSSYFDELCKV